MKKEKHTPGFILEPKGKNLPIFKKHKVEKAAKTTVPSSMVINHINQLFWAGL